MKIRQILKSINYHSCSSTAIVKENGKKHFYYFTVDPWAVNYKDLNSEVFCKATCDDSTGRLIKDVPFGATVHVYIDKSTTVVIPYWKFLISEIF